MDVFHAQGTQLKGGGSPNALAPPGRAWWARGGRPRPTSAFPAVSAAGPQPGCRSHRMLISSWPACASPFKEGSFVFMAEASKVPGVRRTKRASPGAGALSGGLCWPGWARVLPGAVFPAVLSSHCAGTRPPAPRASALVVTPGQSCALGTWSTRQRGPEPRGAGARTVCFSRAGPERGISAAPSLLYRAAPETSPCAQPAEALLGCEIRYCWN